MTTSNQINPLTVAVFVDNYLETYTNEQNKLRSRGTTGHDDHQRHTLRQARCD